MDLDNSHYDALVAKEREFFAGDAPSSSLPPIFTFWASKYLSPRLRNMFGTDVIEEFFAGEVARVCRNNPNKWKILSLGSGECSTEIEIATRLKTRGAEFSICCTDISSNMIAAGKRNAAKAGLTDQFLFQQIDINRDFPVGPWDVVIANHCLHHFVELEHIFENVKNSIGKGALITSDMIGRNGHQRWPEVLKFVEGAWNMLPAEKRFDCMNKLQHSAYVNFDCANGTFEGIRAQDILPIMLQKFQFERFLGFGGIPDIFIDRMYGPNFDPNNETDRSFIDFLEMINQTLMVSGMIKPTMMFATVRVKANSCTYDPVHPYGAVRLPDMK